VAARGGYGVRPVPDIRAAARLLQATELFGALDEPAVLELAALARPRSFRRGQYVMYEGDPGDTLMVVQTGRLKVMVSSVTGEEIVLSTLGPADVVGELALLDGEPRSASVVAAEATTVLLFGRAVLLDAMRRHGTVLEAVLHALAEMVRRLTEQASDFVFLDLGGRLAKLLLRLAEDRPHGPEGIVIDLGLSQSELAAMVGASRQALNRALHIFAARGLISLDGQRIVLRDPDALRQRAKG
jgi:CRP/FNR family transcriptional regulator, cyclic AMP receptor protein